MTRKEAQALIARIAAGEIQPYRTKHVRERLVSREYTIHDILAIVRSHDYMSTPEWVEETQNFKVELHGRCIGEGRATILVVGLRLKGDCTYVSIMPNRRPARRRR